MPNELEVLKEVCLRLEKASIPYMLTGSFAANFYAIPRMTRDIDLVIEILKSHLDQFIAAFQEGFYLDRDAINEAIERHTMFNIVHQASVYKIDFIIRKESQYRLLEFQRRIQKPLDEINIWTVSPEDLIISKLFWAKESMSEMQIRDVRNLMASVKQLDLDYISHWIGKLGLENIYEKVLVHA